MLLFHGTNDNINRLVVKSDVSFGGLFCGTLGDAKAHGKNILVCKVNEADGINANSLAYEDGFYDICKELFANVADLELFDWFIDLLNADCNTQLDEQAEDSDEERAEKKSKREFLCRALSFTQFVSAKEEYNDPGDYGWGLQAAVARVAFKMGYKYVTVYDELGAVEIVCPGTKFRKINS